MTVLVTIGDRQLTGEHIANYIRIESRCPHCVDEHDDAHLRMPRPVPLGTPERTTGWTGEAECQRCGAVVGRMVVHLDTLWGFEEDAAVLVHGRARVY